MNVLHLSNSSYVTESKLYVLFEKNHPSCCDHSLKFKNSKFYQHPQLPLRYKIFLTLTVTCACFVYKIIMLFPDVIQFLTRTQCGSIGVVYGIVVCDEFKFVFRIALYCFDIFNQLKTSIQRFFRWLGWIPRIFWSFCCVKILFFWLVNMKEHI